MVTYSFTLHNDKVHLFLTEYTVMDLWFIPRIYHENKREKIIQKEKDINKEFS